MRIHVYTRVFSNIYIYFVHLNGVDILTTAPEVSRYQSSRYDHAPSSFAYFPSDNVGPIPPPPSLSLPHPCCASLVVHFRNTNRQGDCKGRVITARFLQYGLSTNGHLIFAPPITTYYLCPLSSST